MSELQKVRKKIHGDFFLEKSYREGKLFYEVLRYKDDYIGINYGYFEDDKNNFVAMTSYKILIDTAKVNIYLSKDYRNKKYSQEILSESINKFLSDNKNIKSLWACILEENIASKKLFENLGFIYNDKKEICNDGLEYLVYKKDTIQ